MRQIDALRSHVRNPADKAVVMLTCTGKVGGYKVGWLPSRPLRDPPLSLLASATLRAVPDIDRPRRSTRLLFLRFGKVKITGKGPGKVSRRDGAVGCGACVQVRYLDGAELEAVLSAPSVPNGIIQRLFTPVGQFAIRHRLFSLRSALAESAVSLD